jgi:hypothetical protein
VVSALGSERRPEPGPTLRRRIAELVSAAIAISYLDRQTLPVAIKAIERDIPVTNQQFSLLQTAFLITYAVIYAAGRWGPGHASRLDDQHGVLVGCPLSHGLAGKPNARRGCTPAPSRGGLGGHQFLDGSSRHDGATGPLASSE